MKEKEVTDKLSGLRGLLMYILDELDSFIKRIAEDGIE